MQFAPLSWADVQRQHVIPPEFSALAQMIYEYGWAAGREHMRLINLARKEVRQHAPSTRENSETQSQS
jgi:hypothetical protein